MVCASARAQLTTALVAVDPALIDTELTLSAALLFQGKRLDEKTKTVTITPSCARDAAAFVVSELPVRYQAAIEGVQEPAAAWARRTRRVLAHRHQLMR